MSVNEYEAQRLSNIEANKEVLRELGLERPPPIFIAKRKKATSDKRKVSRRFNESQNNTASSSDSNGRLRRSGRLSEKPQKNLSEDMLFMGIEGEPWRKATVRKIAVRKIAVYESDPNWRQNRPDPHQFGNIPGHEVGSWWPTRMACCHSGVHAPTVAGIAWNEGEGATSIALSGGYEDDVDWGEAFTYTGSGGRDLKGTKNNPKNLRTAPQSKDQELVAGNLALKISCETKRPIRVIRGFRLNNEYAPQEGYRYDGLYTVEKWWESIGKSGYRVYKYAFKRMEGQPPLGTCFMPLDKDEDENKNEDEEDGNEDENEDGNEDENEDGNEDENEDEDGNIKKKLKL